MKRFRYIAYDGAGKRQSGALVAESEAAASRQLRAQGLFVSDLQAGSTGGAASGATGGAAGGPHPVWRRSALWSGRGRLNRDLQLIFTRQMAVLLAANLSLEQALEALQGQDSDTASAAKAARNGPLAAVTQSARAALLDGAPLAEALAQSGAGFAQYYLAAIRAGEGAGDLAAVFAALADHLDSRETDRARISAALVYPAFITAVALLVCAILMTTVAPELAAMFALSGHELPQITRVTLAVSGWIEDNLALLGLAGLAGGGVIVLSTLWDPLWQRRARLALRLPLVGRLMRQEAAVQYLNTLGLVLSCRHTVLSATEAAGEVLEIAGFRAEATRVSEAIRRGDPLARALDQLSFLPPVARQLIQAGEAAANLAQMSARSAQLLEGSLRSSRKRIATLLEPILMLLVGTLVLGIILSVLLPIFDLQTMVAG